MSVDEQESKTTLMGRFGNDKAGNLTPDTNELVDYISKEFKFESQSCIFGGFTELSETEKEELVDELHTNIIEVDIVGQVIVAPLGSAKEVSAIIQEWAHYAGLGGLYTFLNIALPKEEARKAAIEYFDTGEVSEAIKIIIEDTSDGDLNAFSVKYLQELQ